MKEPTFKPLLYTTTVRNPQRLKSLLYILAKFDGQILTNELATQIVGELIKYGLYRPFIQSVEVKRKWTSTSMGKFADSLLTNEEVNEIIANNPQNHKEAGFPKGYPSRFATTLNDK